MLQPRLTFVLASQEFYKVQLLLRKSFLPRKKKSARFLTSSQLTFAPHTLYRTVLCKRFIRVIGTLFKCFWLQEQSNLCPSTHENEEESSFRSLRLLFTLHLLFIKLFCFNQNNLIQSRQLSMYRLQLRKCSSRIICSLILDDFAD